MSPTRLVLALMFSASFGCSVGAAAPQEGGAPLPPAFSEPIPLYPRALGPLTRPISSTVPEAQAYFDQGLQMMYAFATMDAARSFREAERLDPTCAICFWGEAWAWGSYLNAPMTSFGAPHAYRAITKAVELADGRATEIERALIEAMATRYVEKFDPATSRVQDEAYSRAMAGVYERYPDDLDVATLYAESLFLLEPRRGSRDIRTAPVQRILAVLGETIARGGNHVGACHLLIHLTEATTLPERGEECADAIGSAIPGASHINHMPSHTWNEIGRWGDSVRANIQAWHSDQKAAIGEGFAIYPTHNLHMLAFAASMDGQGAIAMQAGRDYTRLSRDPMFEVMTMVRFGRFAELREMTATPAPGAIVSSGVWHFGQGYAHLRNDDVDRARVHLEQLRADAGKEAVFRFHSANDLLGSLAAVLDGEIKRAGGDLDGAIAAFEDAVRLDDAMIYDEPEPLMFAARHWLGAALLDANRPADAARVFREDLDEHPHNGWALFGLEAALDALGQPTDDVTADLDASWARSDTWLRRAAP